MKTFLIGEQTLQMIMGYLGRCPYVDVERIIGAIRNDIRMASIEKPPVTEQDLSSAGKDK
jgi:hypothetical protein